MTKTSKLSGGGHCLILLCYFKKNMYTLRIFPCVEMMMLMSLMMILIGRQPHC